MAETPPHKVDTGSLSPTELVRLLNSTPLGPVINAARLNRQMNDAGFGITASGSGNRVNLLRYVAWLARRRDVPAPVPISYEEKRRREAARNLALSREGRDIGAPPEVADPQRRARCGESFRGFCETYFASAFCLAWSEDHLRVMAKIERAVLEGGLFAFAMPRGSGKTTLARVAGLWAILYGFRNYVCLIGSAEEQAKMLLEATKKDLLTNALLLEDFPETVYPIRRLENNARRQIGQLCMGVPTYITWSADKLVLPTVPPPPEPPEAGYPGAGGGGTGGAVITVAGLDSNIRGQQHTRADGTVVRPSLVILDDPQTRQSAASPSQTRHRLAILNGDVLGMAGPTQKIAGFMTCTKIYHDDLADRVLDREKHPEWQGACTKMVYAFPASPGSQKLWDEYGQLRADGLREGDGGLAATEFYGLHRAEMDEGSDVAWPARFNPDELSALQHAVNLKLRDEAAFRAEYQNEPVTDQPTEDVLTPETVLSRVNGRSRGDVPASATTLTMFIDVHDKMLFYMVCAWEPDFTGYVIDYGTHPDQKRPYFTMRDAPRTLAQMLPGAGAGVEGVVQHGLERLAGDYLGRLWGRGDGTSLRVEKCLIDSGYLPGVVANVCHRLGAVLMPSKGIGIKAGNKPMSAYRRHPGEKHGHHWYVPNVRRTSEFPHVQIDTNYWKSFSHARLMMAPGDRGCLTLFGAPLRSNEHRLLADHLAAAETSVRTEGHGRMVSEWTIRPPRPDNHWFDCLVGCAVGASMQGITIPGVAVPVQRVRRKVRLSDYVPGGV